MPTPAGVPVAMMSPASRVNPADSSLIRVGMSKIRCLVFECWRSSPLIFAADLKLQGQGHGGTMENVRPHGCEGIQALSF